MDSFGFGGSFAVLLAFAVVLPLGLLVLVVLVLAGGRDIDPTGRRTFTLYVAVVSFVALFTALIASTALVSSVTQKIEDDSSSSSDVFEEFPESFPGEGFPEGGDGGEVTQNDEVLQGVVQAGLVLAVAVVVLVFHVRRRREYVAVPGFDGSAAWRADRAYLYAVCFTAVLVFLFATGFGAYNVFQLASPGVFGSGGDDTSVREAGLRGLLTLGWLGAASGAIFAVHWRDAQTRTLSDPPVE